MLLLTHPGPILLHPLWFLPRELIHHEKLPIALMTVLLLKSLIVLNLKLLTMSRHVVLTLVRPLLLGLLGLLLRLDLLLWSLLVAHAKHVKVALHFRL